MSKEELLRAAAARPTLDRIDELAERLPEDVQPLLIQMGKHLFTKKYSVIEIRREVDATDWHVRVLQREIGFTLRCLMRELRLEVSLRMLRDTPLTVEEIAPLMGYASKRALERAFRALCGFTTKQVRKYLRRLTDESRELVDELLSWSFRVRHHRGEVEAGELRTVLSYLEGRSGRS